MIVIPAIDIMDGKAVRLERGKKDTAVVYSENPIEIVDYFNDIGIDRIHIVDLDAAFSGGKKNNRELIRKLASRAKAFVEVGGGVRSLLDVEELLCCYVNKVVVGTMPVKNPIEFEKVAERFSDRIIAGVDVEDGFVKISGWEENPHIDYIAFLFKMRDMGINEAIVTDIKKDGLLEGIDFEFYKDIALKTDLEIIISGGVKDIEDIKKAKKIEKYGIKGIIIGKAFYEKTISLEEALEVAG